jgi:hypothetical protein
MVSTSAFVIESSGDDLERVMTEAALLDEPWLDSERRGSSNWSSPSTSMARELHGNAMETFLSVSEFSRLRRIRV